MSRMEQDNDDTFLTLIQVLSGGITLEERGEMHEKIVKEISRATAIDSQVVYSYWEILLPRDPHRAPPGPWDISQHYCIHVLIDSLI